MALGWFQGFTARAKSVALPLAVVASTGLTCVPIAPVAPSAGQSGPDPVITLGQVFRTTLQYQARFGPVRPPEEVVTVDKWQIHWQGPPRVKVRPLIAPALTPKTIEPNNTVTIEKWQQPLGTKAVPRRPVAKTNVTFPAYPYGQTVYYVQTISGAVFSRSFTYEPLTFFLERVPDAVVDNTVTIDKWQRPLSVLAAKGRPVWHTQPVFGYPYTQVEPEAPQEFNLASVTTGQIAQRTLFYQALFSPGYAPVAVVDNNQTIDKWQQPLSRAAKRRDARHTQPVYTTVAFNNNVPGGWWQPLRGKAVPLRPVRRTQPVYGFPYEAAVTLRTEWWTIQWRGPPKVRPRHTQPVYAFRREPVAVTADTWLRPWTPAVPRRAVWRTQPVYGFPYAAADNTVTVEKWLQRWAVAPRNRPRITQPVYTTIAFPFPAVAYEQAVDATITLTVEFHICGWGTETQATDAAITEGEQSDAWVIQSEVDVTFGPENAQTDGWSEQSESDDEYDEKDECGRG